MKPGYITVFPYKFTYVVKGTSARFSWHWDITRITEEETIEALTELSEKDGFSEWKNDLGL